MAIVLPEGHPYAGLGVAASELDGRRGVRIGILNIMPRLEQYEVKLLEPLARDRALIEPVLIRLTSHGYQSSDDAHLARFYRSFDRVLADAPLDGLILTGAPVEELAFEDVHYFRELTEILGYAREHIACTLGLCWGGLAIGKLLGIEKRLFPAKLFGVFEDRVLVSAHDVAHAPQFPCAHSRHSGFVEEELERAALAGVVRLLSRGAETGYSMFETVDRRFLAHLGHPEYDGERLAFEYRRDRALGRTDVEPPVNLDLDTPVTTWEAHRAQLFGGFVARAAAGIPRFVRSRGAEADRTG